MLVGFNFLEDSCPDTYPASTFLDTGEGAVPGMRSGRVMVRINVKGRPDPNDVAQRAKKWARSGCRIQVLNEPNHPIESLGGDRPMTADEYGQFFRDVAVLVGDSAKLYWAGPSPGFLDWEDYLQHSAVKLAYGISVHGYGQLQQIKDQLWPAISGWPDKKIWVSEFNFGAGNQVEPNMWAFATIRPLFDWLSTFPNVEAATYFAYQWPNPDSGQGGTKVDAKGTAIEAIIKFEGLVKTLGPTNVKSQSERKNIGQGFLKAKFLLGEFVEDGVYHLPGTQSEVQLAVAERGYATWSPRTNEVVVHLWDGRIFRDLGNRGSGTFLLVGGKP